jgi:hypothetical protein
VLPLAGAVLVAPATAAAAQVLYVGNDNTPGQVLQYDLPLTASSVPNFAIASNNVVAVASDANGNLAVGDNAGHLQFYTTPLSGASTPAAVFNNGAASNVGQIAFTNAGDFWAATVSNRMNAFTGPFSNASTPSTFVTNGTLVAAIGTAFDSAQNLYVSNAFLGTTMTCSSGAGTCSDLLVYAPPYTGAPIITPNVTSTSYRKIAVSSTQLFAASVANSPGKIDVYNLPITVASVPAFSLTTGVNIPEALALDAVGNLYVGNLSDSTVTVYTAPITSGSVPSLIYKVSTGAFAIFGIAIGNTTVTPIPTPIPIPIPTPIPTSTPTPAPTPAPASPNSNFATVSGRVNTQTGAITFTESVSDPGTFSFALTFPNGKFGVFAAKKKPKCMTDQIKLKAKCRPAMVGFGFGTKAVAAPGSVSFTVTPRASATKALKSALKRKRSLSVTAMVTYQSVHGGAPVSHSQTITDKLAKGKTKNPKK